ncbi:Hypothetical protein HVR_LOCUS1198 [uncultured virus]|nr:Hypothetical protein HVR_LOCUS1198 [uncultured virus]
MDKETDVIWYSIDATTEDELRTYLAAKRNNAERALESISMSSLDYINNFTNYITLNDDAYCKSLFQNKLSYLIGSIIGKGKVGQVALLSKNNIDLIIKNISTKPVPYLSLRILDHPGDDQNPWNNYYNIYAEDGKRKIVAAGGDNFANQTSMHLILNLILGNNPHYIHQYDAFYCDGIGYNVIEYSNYGDLHKFLEDHPIDDDLIFNVIGHVLAPLSVLKHPMYNFNHSDLKAKNIFVRESNGNIQFKIADYDKSSITWKGYRFYNWSYNYGIVTPIKIEKDETGLDIYVLSSILGLQLYTMHNPYGVPMSYDIYTFILSLFAIKNVWTKYINSELPRFKSLMHRLFKGELYYIIMGKIAQDHAAVVSIAHINKLIDGIRLQYDLSYVYQLVNIPAPPLTGSISETIKITVSKDGHLCMDECDINAARNSYYKTCVTNHYSKTAITGTSTIYNWDYC